MSADGAGILLGRRAEILALFAAHGVATYRLEAGGADRVSARLTFAAADVRDHFRRLDAVVAGLRAMGLDLRQHANGFDARAFDMRGGRGTRIVLGIVSRYRAYFDFWAVVDDADVTLEMPHTPERLAELERGLTYTDIRRGRYGVVVDGLQSRAPSATITRALDGLYHHGTDAELADLLSIVREAQEVPPLPDRAEREAALLAAVTAVARPRTVLRFHAGPRPDDAHLRSHAFGPACAGPGDAWPVNAASGRPLALVLQLVGVEVVPGAAVLQLFADLDDLPYEGTAPGWHVRTFAEVPALALEPPEARGYAAIETLPDVATPPWRLLGKARGGKAITDACAVLDPELPEAAYEAACAQVARHPDAWSFVGGFPRAVQDTPGFRRGRRFVLQVASETPELVWGDAGAAYLGHDPRTGSFDIVVQSS